MRARSVKLRSLSDGSQENMPKNAVWFGRLALMFEERIVLDSVLLCQYIRFQDVAARVGEVPL